MIKLSALVFLTVTFVIAVRAWSKQEEVHKGTLTIFDLLIPLKIKI